MRIIDRTSEGEKVCEVNGANDTRKLNANTGKLNAKEMERLIGNIIHISTLDKCKNYEEILYKIMINASKFSVTWSNVIKQFISELSVLKNEHHIDNVKLESIINLMKKFTMTEETLTQMVRTLLDKSGFEAARKIIEKLRHQEYDIKPDHNDENCRVKNCQSFRRCIVNEAQDRFQILLENISQAPVKMFSSVIVLCHLFEFEFITKTIVADICSNLYDRVNDSNRSFITLYFNIILEICTPRLTETDAGRLLREEIFELSNELIL